MVKPETAKAWFAVAPKVPANVIAMPIESCVDGPVALSHKTLPACRISTDFY